MTLKAKGRLVYSGEMILGRMMVSTGAGLLKKTGRWQEGIGKIRTACPGYTESTHKEQGHGV